MRRTVLVCDCCGVAGFLGGDWYEVVVQHRVGVNGKSGIPAHYEICSACLEGGSPMSEWPLNAKKNLNADIIVERKDL